LPLSSSLEVGATLDSRTWTPGMRHAMLASTPGRGRWWHIHPVRRGAVSRDSWRRGGATSAARTAVASPPRWRPSVAGEESSSTPRTRMRGRSSSCPSLLVMVGGSAASAEGGRRMWNKGAMGIRRRRRRGCTPSGASSLISGGDSTLTRSPAPSSPGAATAWRAHLTGPASASAPPVLHLTPSGTCCCPWPARLRLRPAVAASPEGRVPESVRGLSRTDPRRTRRTQKPRSRRP
jgi:hypothetical protein